jgi:hypothetical protein
MSEQEIHCAACGDFIPLQGFPLSDGQGFHCAGCATDAEVEASLIPDSFLSEEEAAAYRLAMEEDEKKCHTPYITGSAHDPYGTACDLPKKHGGLHEGYDPFGEPERIEWAGGGSCAGDRLPYRDMRALPPRIPYDQMSDADLIILYFLGELNTLQDLAGYPNADQILITQEWDKIWAYLEHDLGISLQQIGIARGQLDWRGQNAPVEALLAWKGQTAYPDEGSSEEHDILLYKCYALRIKIVS